MGRKRSKEDWDKLKSEKKASPKKNKKDLKSRRIQVEDMIKSVDISTNNKLKSKCKVDLRRILSPIKEELAKYNEVDITEFKELRRLCRAKQREDEIDRLCDLKALKKSERGCDSDSGDEMERPKKLNNKKDSNKTKKKTKKLGDMSSDDQSGVENVDHSDEEEV